ncbi:phenylalanine--tRNA ligase subunit alpha, partial [Bacteroidota bacterium]
MQEKIKRLLEEAHQFVSKDAEAIEEFRIAYLGKKGYLSSLFAEFKSVPNELKKEV